MTFADDLTTAIEQVDDDLAHLVAIRDGYATLLDLATTVPQQPTLGFADVERQLDDPLDRARWHNALTTIANHLPEPITNEGDLR